MIPTNGVRAWIPRPLVRLMKRACRIGWYGDYPDWQAACRHARGYDDPAISERVADATKRVLAGEGDHERDGVIIPYANPRWPVLASLLHVLAVDRHLRVLDFGGSLASTLHQHRQWLVGYSDVEWMVVEQLAFVELGRQLFSEEVVRFTASLPAVDSYRANVVFVSSSLQYVPQPWAMLDKLLALQAQHLVIDRTAFRKDRDQMTVQRVPKRIYPASYPAWFLDHGRLQQVLAKAGFQPVAEWSSDDDPTLAGTWFGGGHWRRTSRA